jgi:hypothetical protein
MVSTSRIDQLIARHGITQLQPSDQPPLVQKIQNAVNARAGNPSSTSTQTIFNLNGSQRTRLTGKQVNNCVPRTTLPMPSLTEHRPRVLSPRQSLYG